MTGDPGLMVEGEDWVTGSRKEALGRGRSGSGAHSLLRTAWAPPWKPRLVCPLATPTSFLQPPQLEAEVLTAGPRGPPSPTHRDPASCGLRGRLCAPPGGQRAWTLQGPCTHTSSPSAHLHPVNLVCAQSPPLTDHVTPRSGRSSRHRFPQAGTWVGDSCVPEGLMRIR